MQRNTPGQPPRGAPHNLYGLGPKLVALGGKPVPPPPLFQYVASGSAPVTGRPVLAVHLGFLSGYDPTYTWDRANGLWRRSLGGVPSTVTSGVQIAPMNVVVQFTQYPAESEGKTVGDGDVWIFSNGTLRTGRWTRPDRSQPARYTDANGAPLLLQPGRTWVELLPVAAQVDITFGP
jgi:hypothetical protein